MGNGTEIPNDKVLSQLPIILNASAMRRIFQEKIFPDLEKYLIRDCFIKRVKYRPAKNCMVCYQLNIFDVQRQKVGEQTLCVMVYEKEGAISRFIKAKKVKRVMPKYGKSLSYISELEMVVWAFPNDRKLDGMSKITDPVFVGEEILPEYFSDTFGEPWGVADFELDVVHYVPEHTCTVRVQLKGPQVQNHGEEAEDKPTRLYGKTYYNEDGHRVFEQMQALWQSGSRHSGRLNMARPLGYHKTSKSLWQCGLRGASLQSYDMNSPEFITLLGEAASTVGALHTSPLPCLKTVHRKDIVEKLLKMKQLLSQGRPTCKNILYPLVSRLVCQADLIKEDTYATLHGDLHLNNFIVEDEKVALIDMDNLYEGSPLLDLGSFFAGILYRLILTETPESHVKEMGEVFLRQYEQSVPWVISLPALRWHVAMMLINERAFRCLTRLKAGRLDILDQVVVLADQISLEEDDKHFTLACRR